MLTCIPSSCSHQSERYEVFIEESKRGYRAFNMLLLLTKDKILIQEGRDLIIWYACHQARREPQYKNFIFANFSLVVSFGVVVPQVFHIDMKKPFFQFSVMITDGAYGTLIRDDDQTDVIFCVQDLAKLWLSCTPIPDPLLKAIHENSEVKELIKSYGSLFAPLGKILQPKLNSDLRLKGGTLWAFPGNFIHASPRSDATRAIFFCEGSPPSNSSSSHSRSNEPSFFPAALVIALVERLWIADTICYVERLCLLQICLFHVENHHKTSNIMVWHHISDNPFRSFLIQIENSKEYSGVEVDNLTKAAASREDLFY